MPATLQLAGASLIMVILLSLPIGFLCAVYKDGWFDRIMRGIVFMTTAMPAYWVGLLMMWLISIKLDRSKPTVLKELCSLSQTISMSIMSLDLWKKENAAFPVKIKSMSLRKAILSFSTLGTIIPASTNIREKEVSVPIA